MDRLMCNLCHMELAEAQTLEPATYKLANLGNFAYFLYLRFLICKRDCSICLMGLLDALSDTTL